MKDIQSKRRKRQKEKTGIRTKKWFAVVLFLIAVLLIGGRVYLPYWVTDYVNRKIAALDGYSGSIKEIDISLWRGAYQIHHLDIYKTKGGLKTPFVAAKLIDFSIEWKALWHGTIVSEMDIKNITLTFSKSQHGQGADWTQFIDDLTPFEINHLSVNGGKVSYVDYSASSDINLYIDDIRAEITNLRNVYKKNVALPSNLSIQGNSIGHGKLVINGRGNILKKIPDFDLDFKLENASLAAFNDYTRDTVGIDFVTGEIDVYSELAAANGQVTGYVKPIITKMQMIEIGKEINPLHLIWESIVSAFMKIFKNHPQDQFALRIPIEGSIDDPEGNMWIGFWSIFSNAFIHAFPRATDGSIDFKHALEENRDVSQ